MVRKKYNEKYLERKLREGVKGLGSLALKFESDSYTGLPDRQILLPDEKVIWVELKSTGEKPTAEQWRRIKMLRRRGQAVHVVDDMDGVNRVLETTRQAIERARRQTSGV